MFGGVEVTKAERRGEPILEAHMEGIHSLRHLKDSLTRDRVRDSVRAMLTRWAQENDRLTFQLNKQAAYANHVSIYHANKVPMGPIEVGIDGDPAEVIEYLCGKRTDEKRERRPRPLP